MCVFIVCCLPPPLSLPSPSPLPSLSLPSPSTNAHQDSIVDMSPEEMIEGSILGSEFQRTSSFLTHPTFNS